MIARASKLRSPEPARKRGVFTSEASTAQRGCDDSYLKMTSIGERYIYVYIYSLHRNFRNATGGK